MEQTKISLLGTGIHKTVKGENYLVLAQRKNPLTKEIELDMLSNVQGLELLKLTEPLFTMLESVLADQF